MALNESVRITADPLATAYLEQNIIYHGEIHVPVLTLHTTGDGLVEVENESAYNDVVREHGNGPLLRRTFVARAGHCAFTPAETIVAVETLLGRMDTGKWPELAASDLNASASSLGPELNVFTNAQGALVEVLPAFVDFYPAPYLRPFNGDGECKDFPWCNSF